MSGLSAQDPGSGERALSYVQQLCQPQYGGRMTGQPGARAAAEWIGGRFSAWGLQPGGDSGSFLQNFPLIVTRQKGRAVLRLLAGPFGAIDYIEGVDFTVYFNSGSGNFSAEVVFAGYGISEPAMGWDDYAGIDVQGKVVLIYRGLPEDGQDWEFANERDYKTRTASNHGARGLLMLDKGDWPIRGGTIHEEGYRADLVGLNISKKVALDLFCGSFKNMDDVIRGLAKKPDSFPLKKNVHLQARIEKMDSGEGENVVGILTGSDPDLRNEYLVIGGHMDHNGVGSDGHLYPGADDNASGAAVVMELARHFAGLPVRPRRSLVFIGFGGEEQGLRGSKYFAYHPTVPGRQICAMLNFDMEGTGDGGAGMGGRNYFPEAVQQLTASLSDSVMKKFRLGRGWGMGGSDHSHFLEQGIPAMGFYSSGGHPFYHKFEDVPSTLNPASMQFVGDRAADIIRTLTDWPESLLAAGGREGRFFLRHGDQIEFDRDPMPKVDPMDLQSRGIRAIVLPLVSMTGSKGITATYHQLDSLEQSVKKQTDWLLYENSGSLDRAAGNYQLAVAFSLRGDEALKMPPADLRNLLRLGVTFVQFDNSCRVAACPDSSFERQISACQETGRVLGWASSDTSITKRMLSGYKGKWLWSLHLDDALAMAPFIKGRVDGIHSLLMVECGEKYSPGDLSQLIDRIGVKNVHLVPEAGPGPEGLTQATAITGQLYSQRLSAKGPEKAFKEMEQLMGRNLKRILGN